ncbi:MAG TPA: Gfo/Idh/MocA family oxidoreductase [Blastocatellia bacterium]|nr:Gfo/Idh/MocA family oxidoreductase [Blastocatellia bacterium]
MKTGNNIFPRRKFLKETVGAIAVSGALAPGKVLGANDRIRLGAIGVGGRSRKTLIPIHQKQPDTEFVTVCDVYEPHLLRTVSENGMKNVKQVSDYRAILDDKSIDAVVIGAPDHWHAKMVSDAVAAGKDVYVEKPVTHSLEEGAELIRAVESNKRVVQTGTQQRTWPHFIEGKKIIDSGKLGKITFVRMWWFQNYAAGSYSNKLALDKLDQKMWLGKAPAQTITPIKFFWWRWFWDFGGGALTDLMSHWIDVAHWYLDVTAPVSVMTSGNRYVLDWECPDTITSVLDYPKNFSVTYHGTMASSVDDGGLEIRGMKGTMKLDRNHVAVYPEGGELIGRLGAMKPEILIESRGDGTIPHIRNFLDCVKSRKTPTANIRVAVEAARAAHLGNLALKQERRIKWNAQQERIES